MMINPLFDPSTDNQEIPEETQKMINADLKAEQYSPEDQAFVDHILKLVNNGQIKLHEPSSLINAAVYAQLPPEAQGKADLNAMNMLAKVRQIVTLSKTYEFPTYQMISLVAGLRQNKENLEQVSGDIYVL